MKTDLELELVRFILLDTVVLHVLAVFFFAVKRLLSRLRYL